MNRVLILDLATLPELASPYVRYIFENYFANPEESQQINEILHYIESLNLDRNQLSQVKLLVLLQSGML